MKKILLIVLGLIFIFLIAWRFGLSTNNSKLTVKDLPTRTQTAEISQIMSRPIIGIHYRMIDSQTADQNNLVEGAYITQVIKGSPAEKANLQEEDIIIKFDGIKIGSNDKETLNKLIAGKKPGERVVLEIWRNKEIKTVFVTLETTQ